jgi:tRNA threonylcarbamoyladenosine biosynthesis protein TsaB
MMLLAIDTASRLLGVALADRHAVIAERTWTTANRHSVELSPAIAEMMAQVNLPPRDLTAVAVAQGPGSFTGVRIGMGVAKGMAQALNIPLVAVPSLDIIAAGTPGEAFPLVVVMQAGRGRLVVGWYTWRESRWQPDGDMQLMTWDELLPSITQPSVINGELDERGLNAIHASAKPFYVVPVGYRLRRAGFLAQVAYDRLDHLDGAAVPDPVAVMPIYIKQP